MPRGEVCGKVRSVHSVTGKSLRNYCTLYVIAEILKSIREILTVGIVDVRSVVIVFYYHKVISDTGCSLAADTDKNSLLTILYYFISLGISLAERKIYVCSLSFCNSAIAEDSISLFLRCLVISCGELDSLGEHRVTERGAEICEVVDPTKAVITLYGVKALVVKVGILTRDGRIIHNGIILALVIVSEEEDTVGLTVLIRLSENAEFLFGYIGAFILLDVNICDILLRDSSVCERYIRGGKNLSVLISYVGDYRGITASVLLFGKLSCYDRNGDVRACEKKRYYQKPDRDQL